MRRRRWCVAAALALALALALGNCRAAEYPREGYDDPGGYQDPGGGGYQDQPGDYYDRLQRRYDHTRHDASECDEQHKHGYEPDCGHEPDCDPIEVCTQNTTRGGDTCCALVPCKRSGCGDLLTRTFTGSDSVPSALLMARLVGDVMNPALWPFNSSGCPLKQRWARWGADIQQIELLQRVPTRVDAGAAELVDRMAVFLTSDARRIFVVGSAGSPPGLNSSDGTCGSTTADWGGTSYELAACFAEWWGSFSADVVGAVMDLRARHPGAAVFLSGLSAGSCAVVQLALELMTNTAPAITPAGVWLFGTERFMAQEGVDLYDSLAVGNATYSWWNRYDRFPSWLTAFDPGTDTPEPLPPPAWWRIMPKTFIPSRWQPGQCVRVGGVNEDEQAELVKPCPMMADVLQDQPACTSLLNAADHSIGAYLAGIFNCLSPRDARCFRTLGQ